MGASHVSRIDAANAELIVKGRLDAAEEFFTQDYVAHVTDRKLTGGPAFVREFVTMLHDAFSDLEVEVEILVDSGDRVAWQRTITGTHTGAFRGFPASGRRVVWRDMVTSRFDDGRIAEDWVVTDLAERLLLSRKSGS